LRRRGSPIGLALYLGGLSVAVEAALQAWARAAFGGADLVGGQWAAWASDFLWAPGFASLYVILLVFPSGRLLSRRWRPVLWLALGVPAMLTLSLPWLPGTLQDYAPWQSPAPRVPVLSTVPVLVTPVFLVLLPLLFLACAAALIIRFVRSRALERAQLKWLALGAGVGVVCNALSYLPGHPAVFSIAANASISLLPVTIGLAILRHRLYDIDRILSRTVAYAVLTTLLVATYVGIVTVVTRLVPTGNSVAVAGSTLAVAALFQPLRRRVQAAVDRRCNRARYDAARTVESFSRRLRGEVDLETVRSDLLGVVHHTMAPASVSVWLRPTLYGWLFRPDRRPRPPATRRCGAPPRRRGRPRAGRTAASPAAGTRRPRC